MMKRAIIGNFLLALAFINLYLTLHAESMSRAGYLWSIVFWVSIALWVMLNSVTKRHR